MEQSVLFAKNCMVTGNISNYIVGHVAPRHCSPVLLAYRWAYKAPIVQQLTLDHDNWWQVPF